MWSTGGLVYCGCGCLVPFQGFAWPQAGDESSLSGEENYPRSLCVLCRAWAVASMGRHDAGAAVPRSLRAEDAMPQGRSYTESEMIRKTVLVKPCG